VKYGAGQPRTDVERLRISPGSASPPVRNSTPSKNKTWPDDPAPPEGLTPPGPGAGGACGDETATEPSCTPGRVSDGWTAPKEVAGEAGCGDWAPAGDKPSGWECRGTDEIPVVERTSEAPGRLVGKAVGRPVDGEGSVLAAGLFATGDEAGGT
jgi:hypothetical protein